MRPSSRSPRPAHPAPIRIMHWIGVYAMGCMIFSGWAIYNASPDLPFVFPRWTGLGGWLGGALAWHLSAMWLLVINGLAYLVYGIASGHFRRNLRLPSPMAVIRDLRAALAFRLAHRQGHYNAVQRAMYVGVVTAAIVQIVTGLAIWKPVQFQWLVELFGQYAIARNIHLALMFGIVAFVVVHVTLVAIHPRTLVAMIAPVPAESEEQH